MAELVSIKRNVDVSPGQAAPAVFHCSQGDVGSKIILGLLNNGTAYSIPSGVTVTIEGSESNGSIFTPISATASESDITFNLTGEMTAVAGPAICQAVLKSGSNILGTANFTLEVESSPMGADAPPVFTDAGWTWMLNKLTTEFVPALGDNIIDAIESKADQSDLTALSNTVAGHTGSITVLNNTVNTLNHGVTENRQNIARKLDKNQGTANAGKYLKVGADGNVAAEELDVTTDKTLSIADKAADAKVVGDELTDLKADFNVLVESNSCNALELMNTKSTTDFGITFTHDSDGTMHVTGTTENNDAWFRYCYGARPEWLVPGSKCWMQLDAASTKIALRMYWYVEESFKTRIRADTINGTGELEFTVPTNCNGLIALLVVENGKDTINETVHPKVMLGKTNAELTVLANQFDKFDKYGYKAKNVVLEGYIKKDETGEYIDIDDLCDPGTYLMETSTRKVNAPSSSINCVKTESYGYYKTFLKQTGFNITVSENTYVIDESKYVRYKNGRVFTPWVECVEIKKQNELYHSTTNFNAYDILYPFLYEHEAEISGLTYTFGSDGDIHVQGTTTANSFYEIHRGSLPESFIRGKKYYVKMDSASGSVKLRLYFYDSAWSSSTRVAYFIPSDQEITVPDIATNCIIWIGVEENGQHITIDETCHPAILTRQPVAPTINNNTFNYNVHKDTYNVTATPTIQATSDLYLAATGTTADRTADIMTLLQTQKVCKLGVGDFYIKTGVDMPDGTSIIGCGRGTRIILDSSVTEGYAISVGTYCSVQDLHLVGMASGSLPYEEYTPGGRDGIVLLGDATGFDGGSTFTHNFAKLSNLWIDDFNGSGVKAYRNDGAASFLAENIDILRCGVGVNIAMFSEFHSWTNIRTRWCVYACIMNGGNNLFSNCHFDVNMHGLLIDNSLGNLVNDTHSSFTNCTWCHIANNTGNAIEVINTQNGLAFSNCQIFYSKIILTDTKGVTIQGFNIGANEDIIITRCKGINISNCIFGGVPNIQLDTVTGFIFENNMTKEGVLVPSP